MYRIELVPRGIWIVLVIALLLVILMAFSIAMSSSRTKVVFIGSEVETGNPADYVEKPTPPPSAPPEAAPTPPVVTPVPPPSPSPPRGLPATVSFGGKSWRFSGGPIGVEVVTTGQYTDDQVIYRKQGDQPPYDALYIESAPNSGKFYKYVPA